MNQINPLSDNQFFSSDYNTLLFNNEDFSDIIISCYDLVESDYIKKVAKTIYPNLQKDFDNYIKQIKEQVNKLDDIRRNYISIFYDINRIYNKYSTFATSQFEYK